MHEIAIHIPGFSDTITARGSLPITAKNKCTYVREVVEELVPEARLPYDLPAAFTAAAVKHNWADSTRVEAVKAVRTFSKYLKLMAVVGRDFPDQVNELIRFPARVRPLRPRRVLSDDEIARLLAVPMGKKNGLLGEARRLLYRLALDTGLRKGTLIALTPQSFAQDREKWVVRATGYQTKTGKPIALPISATTALQIANYCRLFGIQPDQLLFRPKFPKNLSWTLRCDLTRAKIPYQTSEGFADFHSLRHTAAVRLVRSGAPAAIIQRFLGHTSPEQTLHYLDHYGETDLREWCEKIERK